MYVGVGISREMSWMVGESDERRGAGTRYLGVRRYPLDLRNYSRQLITCYLVGLRSSYPINLGKEERQVRYGLVLTEITDWELGMGIGIGI